MAAATVQSSTNLFRRLAWNATVPLEIRLANADGRAVDRYYIQAPRYTYLPLLLPSIRQNLVELALDDDQLAKLDESQWWFEEDQGYAEDGADKVPDALGSQGPCQWHWSIDLIELHASIANAASPEAASTPPPTSPPTTSPPTPPTPAKPLRLILHLTDHPDSLVVAPGIESCKNQFTNQIKEADFVRWGNSKRVTSMRRADIESGWDGVVANDFDMHARMAGRLVPLPIPLPPSTAPNAPPGSFGSGGGGGSGLPSRPGSVEPGQTPSSLGPKLESAYAARSLPLKLYLPNGAPAVQTPVPPLGADGRPTTLIQHLRQHLPLLFPKPLPPASSNAYALAQPIAQGIVLPPDADVAWLAACMAGADGWLRVGIRLVGSAE